MRRKMFANTGKSLKKTKCVVDVRLGGAVVFVRTKDTVVFTE